MKTSHYVSLVAAMLLVGVTDAIVIRHDVAPAQYEIDGSEFPAVFFLEQQGSRRVCAATVIHPQWALTAAHCALETSLDSAMENRRRFAVQVNGRTREIDLMILHPQFDLSNDSDVDLALLRFRTSDNSPPPLPLNIDDDEIGVEVSIVGWGYFGLGTTGRQYDDGKLRRATNRISAVSERFSITFDDPRVRGADSLGLEGMPGLGDSGGPALIAMDTGYMLAGIAVGEIRGPLYREETQGQYGSVAVYERISQHIRWIETVIGSSYPFDS